MESQPAEKPSYSEPEWSTTFRDGKDAPYWLPEIDDKITSEVSMPFAVKADADADLMPVCRMLREYSHVPEAEIHRHVYDTRERLWAVRSYPCTGLGVWLTPELPLCPRYAEILERLKMGARLVDVGAFIGHDLRRLVQDGAPSNNLFAVDIVSHWDLGFDFFRDRGRFHVPFIQSDILHPSPELEALVGTVDVVNIAHVIHQWPRRTQIACIQQLARLTKPGALLVGYQAGNINPRPLEAHAGRQLDKVEDRPEVHDAVSWRKLWHDAGSLIGVQFDVETRLRNWADTGRNPADYEYMGPEMRLLEFVVSRKN